MAKGDQTREMASRAASKREGGRTVISIFERYKTWVVEKGRWKKRWNGGEEEVIRKERNS